MSKIFIKSLIIFFLTIYAIYPQRESWGFIGDREIFIGFWNDDTIYYANSLSCLLNEGYTENDITDFISSYDATIRFDYFEDANWGSIDLPVYYDALELIQEWQTTGLFNSVEPVRLVTTSSGVNDPKYLDGTQWYFNNYGQNPPGGTIDADVDMAEALYITRGSPEILISVIDSGIPLNENTLELSHPDLNNDNRILLEYSGLFVPADYFVRDGYGHGTHVTGILAAETNNGEGIAGVAGNCKIIVCRVFDDQGNGTDDGILAALSHSIQLRYMGLRIINLSLSATNSEALKNMMALALENDIVVVCAAGNWPGSLHYPAAYSTIYSNIITVSATNQNDIFADYSRAGAHINVAAPGGNGPRYTCPNDDDIYSTFPDYDFTIQTECPELEAYYGYLWGTSMSTPIVSGIAAQILSINPDLSATEVRGIIESTADDKGEPGFDWYYGHGRVNAHKALLETLYRLAVQNKSNTNDATGLNGGRRIVKDSNNHYHFVFSSGNNIWYRKSTNTGETWSSPEVLYISSGKNNYPSIAYHNNFLFVTWQKYLGYENNQHLYKIEGVYKQLPSGSWNTMEINSGTIGFSNSTNLLPVIVAADNVDNNFNSALGAPEVMVVFRKPDGIYHLNVFYIQPLGDKSSYIYHQLGETAKIPGTSSGYSNPGIAANNSGRIIITCQSSTGTLHAFRTTGDSWFSYSSSIFNTQSINYGYKNSSISTDVTGDFNIVWEATNEVLQKVIMHRRLYYFGPPVGAITEIINSDNSRQPSVYGHTDVNNGVSIYWQNDLNIKKAIYDGSQWLGFSTNKINSGHVNTVDKGSSWQDVYAWTGIQGPHYNYGVKISQPLIMKQNKFQNEDSIQVMTYRRAEFQNESSNIFLSLQIGNFKLLTQNGEEYPLDVDLLDTNFSFTTLNDIISTMKSDDIPQNISFEKILIDYKIHAKNINLMQIGSNNRPRFNFILSNRNNWNTISSTNEIIIIPDSTLQIISGTVEIPINGSNISNTLGVALRLQGIRQNFLSSNVGINLINSYVLVPEDNYRFSLGKQTETIITYSLAQNYPNPFNPVTQIQYSIVKDGYVTIKIFDILGQEIVTLVNDERPAGVHTVNFNATNLASGIYFYSISSGSFHQTKKMILAR